MQSERRIIPNVFVEGVMPYVEEIIWDYQLHFRRTIANTGQICIWTVLSLLRCVSKNFTDQYPIKLGFLSTQILYTYVYCQRVFSYSTTRCNYIATTAAAAAATNPYYQYHHHKYQHNHLHDHSHHYNCSSFLASYLYFCNIIK